MGNFLGPLPKRRSLIKWEVPHLGIDRAGGPFFIEMYINPQSMIFQSTKLIEPILTKGGYIIQYWGEQLDEYTINGNTGLSSIEGLNVLRDVYRSEQLALEKLLKRDTNGNVKRRQSLAQLAASVVMWYQGQGYRGFFRSMNYTENVDQLGVIQYAMNFTVVELLGKRRKNFLPWQRKPWSTSETPNQLGAQGDGNVNLGGGYDPHLKVGKLNTASISSNQVPSIADTSDESQINSARTFADPKVEFAAFRFFKNQQLEFVEKNKKRETTRTSNLEATVANSSTAPDVGGQTAIDNAAADSGNPQDPFAGAAADANKSSQQLAEELKQQNEIAKTDRTVPTTTPEESSNIEDFQ